MRHLLLSAFVAGLAFGQEPAPNPVLDRAVDALVKRNALVAVARPEPLKPEPRKKEGICSIRLLEMKPLAESAPMPRMKIEHEPLPMPVAVVPAPPCPRPGEENKR